MRYSTILNCFSIIGGYTYTENGAGVWMGFESDPQQNKPAIGESFDITINVFGLGNACSGQRFVPGFSLPAGVQLDTSNRPITCWSSKNGNPLTQFTGAIDCPTASTNLIGTPNTTGGQYAYLSSDTGNARTWPLPAGVHWQFRIPVKATAMQSGSTLQGHVKMFDGNDNPILTPTQGLFVYNGASASATPKFWFEQPTTVASPTLPAEFFPEFAGEQSGFGVYSVGYVDTAGTTGTFYVVLGTTPGGDEMVTPQSPDPGALDGVVAGAPSPSDPYDTYSIATDWIGENFLPLQRGVTYYWQLYYLPTGGGSLASDVQSFTLPSRATCNGKAVTVDLSLGEQPTDGNDVILGTANSETIAAQAGNDTICAEGGNDTILGGLGNDWIDGGAGIDTASYANAPAGVTVSITPGAQATGEGSDTLSSIANLTGSRFADRLTGDGNVNLLGGQEGSDVLTGGGGNDELVGGPGGDTLRGGSGNDDGDGGDGDDTFDGGAGNDDFVGGAGTDTASYVSAGAGVRVSLATTAAQATGGSGTETIRTTENLRGSSAADVLTGNGGRNLLSGDGGGDRLNGAAGPDRLVGGPGTDRCDGGSGSDTRATCEINSGFP